MYFIRFYICREIISNTQWNHLDRTLQFQSDSLEYDFRLRLELCDVLKVKRPLVMHSVSALSCLQVRIRGELVLKQCYVSSLMLRPSKSLLPCPYGLSIGLESRSLMGMNCTPFALWLRDERKFSAAVEFIVHCIVNYSVNIESYRYCF